VEPVLEKKDILCDFPADIFDTLTKYLSVYQRRMAGKLVRRETDLDEQRAVLLSSIDIMLLKVNKYHAKDDKLRTLVRDQRRRWFEECQLQKGFTEHLGPPAPKSAAGGAKPSSGSSVGQTETNTDPEGLNDGFNSDDNNMDTTESTTSEGGTRRRLVTTFKKTTDLSEVSK
jgi:hypothetical protein